MRLRKREIQATVPPLGRAHARALAKRARFAQRSSLNRIRTRAPSRSQYSLPPSSGSQE